MANIILGIGTGLYLDEVLITWKAFLLIEVEVKFLILTIVFFVKSMKVSIFSLFFSESLNFGRRGVETFRNTLVTFEITLYVVNAF